MRKIDKFKNYIKRILAHFFIITFFLSLFGASNSVATDYSDKKIIPIVMATDDGYAYHTQVAMNSIMETKNGDVFIKFYVMIPGNMSWENKERFKNFKNLYKDGCTVDIIDMKDKFSYVKSGIGHITYPTCYRLLIASYLKDYDKVLYIDGDILVRHDLWDLYNTDIKDYYIAGVRDFCLFIYNLEREYATRLGVKSANDYINAGMLVMNTKEIRAEKLENKFLDFLNQKNPVLMDQDTLNAVCYGKIKQINPTYNNMVNYIDKLGNKVPWQFSDCCSQWNWEKAHYDPCIVHYQGEEKPWKTWNVKFYDEWNKRRKKIDDKFYKTIGDGIYTIESALNSNMVLDISGSSRNNEANLQLWDSNGTNAQKFHVFYVNEGLYELAPMCSGKRVDVDHSGKENRTNVWQWEANGTDAQKWYIKPVGNGYYNIISKCNGLCLDVHGAQTRSGTNIWTFVRNGTNAQKFKFRVS